MIKNDKVDSEAKLGKKTTDNLKISVDIMISQPSEGFFEKIQKKSKF